MLKSRRWSQFSVKIRDRIRYSYWMSASIIARVVATPLLIPISYNQSKMMKKKHHDIVTWLSPFDEGSCKLARVRIEENCSQRSFNKTSYIRSLIHHSLFLPFGVLSLQIIARTPRLSSLQKHNGSDRIRSSVSWF